MNILRKTVLSLLLTAAAAMGYAQSNCFTYEDNGQTIINGLTQTGEYAESLTIPATVTRIRSGAFMYANAKKLTIYNGNPAFESPLFGNKANTLTTIDMGNGMSVANMIALLTSLGSGPQGTIVASGFTGNPDASNETWSSVTWTGVTSVILPAALVGNQSFGSAEVKGRFTIAKEIISFCTNATFQDVDNGSNMLFYVADYVDGQRIHIQRVHYIAAGKGVLIHRTENSSGFADLPRVNGVPQASSDISLYASNMLVGVTQETYIDPTDGGKTNLVLKDGAFHPTSRGPIKANKAYLQVPTNWLTNTARLEIVFDEETVGIDNMNIYENDNCYYDMQGRKVSNPQRGLYIVKGKKVLIK